MARQEPSLNQLLVASLAVLGLTTGLLTVPSHGRVASADEAGWAATEDQASQQAKESGKPVLVLGDMTKDTQVSANPDGTFTAILSAGPVREPDPQSPMGWSDIDLTLQPGPDGLHPKLADANIIFSGGGTGTLASITFNGLTFAAQATQTLLTDPAIDRRLGDVQACRDLRCPAA